MRVYIDTSPLQNANAVRGVGRYTKELVDALQTLNTTHTFLTSEDEPGKVDLVHYPFFDLFFPTLPLMKKAKTVVTIHDVTPLVLARHYPRGVRGQLKYLRQRLALRGVTHVITDSACSKRDIIDYLKVRAENISVVPLAATPQFKKQPTSVVEDVRKKYNIPKNYMLYVGDISYNKNLPFLIKVAARIPTISLVLVGREMNNVAIPEGQAIQAAIAQASSQKFVRLVDSVTAVEELAALYSGAACYVQPSLYEGFGLPVIEAMRCKTPVVSSCGGSLAELVGTYGLQFNPTDEVGCEAMLRKALRLGDEERQKLVRKAFEYSETFTWERTARETLAVYEKVVKK